MNRGPLRKAARQGPDDALHATRSHVDELKEGRLARDKVYLVTEPDLAVLHCERQEWSCRTHQGVTVTWPADSYGPDVKDRGE